MINTTCIIHNLYVQNIYPLATCGCKNLPPDLKKIIGRLSVFLRYVML